GQFLFGREVQDFDMSVNIGRHQIQGVGGMINPGTKRSLKASDLVLKQFHGVDETRLFGIGRVGFDYGGKKDEFLPFNITGAVAWH
ncbi:MAG: hypothetical protein HYS56_02325, partial [Candidatus Omnitrophica bacterium]|nr:hypothetical protein [Candidatus Omnitrophota bacterium]